MQEEISGELIAVVGVACRFPGAHSPAEYWRNLLAGTESITWLSEDDLLASGVPASEFRHPDYVNAAFLMDDMECYDNAFFGDTPREAQVRDPQTRWFLETCYSAVWDAGYDPARLDGLVAVVGGMSNNFYGERYVRRNAALRDTVGSMAIGVGSNPDYLATTVSYRLGLRGPSLTVQTACSSALVAIHNASQMLRSGECDVALAGGVEIELPNRIGHQWLDGNIYTRTGHIRPFDAEATGTIFGSGVGVVALKRLETAQADGDHVYAVLRGSAVNNDGGDRAGFTAPGVEGQAQLVVEALAAAQVHPDTIGYVEAHATGTLVGDPIEVAGLDRAYRAAGASSTGTIPIGSVKGNVGHLGPASGVAGLIKVCLALEHGVIPPSINYDTPNAALRLDQTPFFVVVEPTPWERTDGAPRRAAVSSFGIGGTNAHVVLEEAPRATAPQPSRRRSHPLVVSGRTESAVDAQLERLAERLGDGSLDLAAVSHTLRTGRPELAHRAAVVAADVAGAREALTSRGRRRALSGTAKGATSLVMMFPGQGNQFPGMARDLLDHDPDFRSALEECADHLRDELDVPLLDLLLATGGDAAARLARTRYCQPALFSVQYALTRSLAAVGVEPQAMIGHSVGEYVAACVAGVLSLPDALALVSARGRLMQSMEPGSMLAVALPAFLVSPLLPEGTEVAAVNGPELTVIAGADDAIDAAVAALEGRGVTCTRLVTSHAFHSASMEPCLEEFERTVARMPLAAPSIPFVSNVTGTWITDDEATDPGYWARHLRCPVLFHDGVQTLASGGDRVFLDIGPGASLARLAVAAGVAKERVVAAMRPAARSVADDQVLTEAVAALWCQGVPVRWGAWDRPQPRVSLPTYPFERHRFWADPDPEVSRAALDDEAEWPLPAERCAFAPSWREAPPREPEGDLTGRRVLFFSSGHPVSERLLELLVAADARVSVVRPGDGFAEEAPGAYRVRPASAEDHAALAEAVDLDAVTDVVHAWNLADPATDPIDPAVVEAETRTAFSELLQLGRDLARRGGDRLRLTVLSANAQQVTGEELLQPTRALLLGPTMLAERELPHVVSRSVDVALPSATPLDVTARQLLHELTITESATQVGWRGRKRWELDFATVPLAPAPAAPPGGTYLVTGGLGALGLHVAEELAAAGAEALVLVGRHGLPRQAEWDDLLTDPDSPPRTRDTVHRLQQIAGTGCRLVVAACDITDEDDVRALVDRVHAECGPVRGVYHSAGVAGGGMLAVREDAEAAKVLAPKVTGTVVLDRVLGDEVDVMVLFSSLTAVTGTFGQVDYCAANNFQDAFARYAHQQGRPVVSIGWTQWTDSGMSADREAEAPRAFRDLQSGARFEPVDHPLLDRRVIAPSATVEYRTVLAPGNHWVTAEHRLDGGDLVVGTALLEMVRAAYEDGVGTPGQLLDVVFIGPIGVSDPTEVRVELRPDGDGHAVRVTAGRVGLEGERTERLRARVVPATRTTPPVHDLEALKTRCSQASVTADQLRSSGSLIEFGPHWAGAIKHTQLGERESLSLIELDAGFVAECGQYVLHPSLLDTAVAEANYAPDRIESGDSYLPFSYGRITVHEALPPRFWVHSRHLSELGAEVDRMQVVLMHPDGQEIVRVDEYAERRVDPNAIRATVVDDRPAATVQAAEVVEEAASGLDAVSVTPALGRDVLRRIVHWRPAPHLVVVPEGIHRNLRRTQSLTIDVVQSELQAAALVGQGLERSLDTAYEAPATALESTIAALWGSALGVADVGVEDDFFELGGNSPVAVQLSSRIRDTVQVEMPIAILFDHPTVRRLAQYLETAPEAAR